MTTFLFLEDQTRSGLFPPKCGSRDARSIKSCLQTLREAEEKTSFYKRA